VVWGHPLIGESIGTSSNTNWRGLDATSTANRVVWGNLQGLNIAPTSMSWSNLERSNMDIK
jgi:hypothetical protein